MKQTITKSCSLFLFVMMSLLSHAQNSKTEKIISGNVIDNAGKSLPGVNVNIKGTSSGVVTDFEGHYTVTVKEGGVLVFTFIGMKKEERTVGKSSQINVTMQDDASGLEEVVVTGYGKQKKKHLTGAIQTINISEIEDLPTNNIATTLVGRVLGVGVSGGSARPGKPATLKIRNPITLSKDGGTTNPLYVIDGVLQTAGDGTNDTTQFDNLDASEIESISFLKDGAAAIYGARSANGVVIISTKRGKVGPAKFTYQGSYGIEDETYRTKMLSAYEFAQYYNIMNGPNGHNTAKTAEYLFSEDEKTYFKYLNYNPLNDEWRAASNQKHALNVSGGTDRATYFAGGSYYTQGGNLSNVDYSKWTFRSGADFRISNDFKAGIQISGYFNDDSKTFSKVGGENEENDYRRLLNSSPFMPQYINGLPVQRLNTANESQYHFGEINKLGNKATSTLNSMTANAYLEYKVPFIKGLTARASYARTQTAGRSTQVGTRYTVYQFNGVGTNGHIFKSDGELFQGVTLPNNTVSATRTNSNGDRLLWGNSRSKSVQSNLNLSYNREFGKHAVTGLFSVEKSESNNVQDQYYKDAPLLSTNGFSNTAFGAIDGTTTGNESGTLGYVGRLNYIYDDKYMAEFLYRTDASTKFAPENYWGEFYSLSGGWVISKESFFKSSVIDFLKVRASVGVLGKDDTKAWQWRQRFTYQDGKGVVVGNGNATTGLKMEVTPNPDVTWSQELKTNYGVEMKFLSNRLSFNMDYFFNKGTNILMNKTANVPFTVGGSTASENYGEVNFFGYEFAAGWNDKVGDFKYGLDVNFGWSDNKVVTGDFNAIDIKKPWIAKPGESMDNGVWGYDNIGMFKDAAEVAAYVSGYNIKSVFGVLAANLRPGSLYYRDVRGAFDPVSGTFGAPDGIIDENDQIQLAKRKATKYGMGTTLKLGYKQFTLNAVVTASFGGGWNEVDSQTRKTMKSKINDGIDNRASIWNDIYDPVLNPTGKMPNPYNEALNLAPTSHFWSRSATSIQLRNVNLAYAMPEKYTKALGISSCRLNLTALNPFILYNPFEYKNPNGAYDIYPTLKTYSLGLNVAF